MRWKILPSTTCFEQLLNFCLSRPPAMPVILSTQGGNLSSFSFSLSVFSGDGLSGELRARSSLCGSLRSRWRSRLRLLVGRLQRLNLVLSASTWGSHWDLSCSTSEHVSLQTLRSYQIQKRMKSCHEADQCYRTLNTRTLNVCDPSRGL